MKGRSSKLIIVLYIILFYKQNLKVGGSKREDTSSHRILNQHFDLNISAKAPIFQHANENLQLRQVGPYAAATYLQYGQSRYKRTLPQKSTQKESLNKTKLDRNMTATSVRSNGGASDSQSGQVGRPPNNTLLGELGPGQSTISFFLPEQTIITPTKPPLPIPTVTPT